MIDFSISPEFEESGPPGRYSRFRSAGARIQSGDALRFATAVQEPYVIADGEFSNKDPAL